MEELHCPRILSDNTHYCPLEGYWLEHFNWSLLAVVKYL